MSNCTAATPGTLLPIAARIGDERVSSPSLGDGGKRHEFFDGSDRRANSALNSLENRPASWYPFHLRVNGPLLSDTFVPRKRP
jgi:hypothetical protein